MMNEYPDINEVLDFFENFIGLENSINFFKSNGVFFASRSKVDVAKYGSKIIFGFDDFTEIKSMTSTKQKYNKISGFSIKTEKPFDEIKDVFHIGEVLNKKNSLKIKSITINEDSDKLKIHYSFEKKVPGKMSLISTEEREGHFWIESTEDDGIQIALFNHNKNDDYIEIKAAVNESFSNAEEDINIIPFNLTRFSLAERIEFIDAVLKHNYDDWTLEEVITLRVKAGENLSDESEEIIDEEDREFLKGINDAILQGHDLRHNSFVVKCESSGYYFPSVIMKISHKTEPYIAHLEVQFKFRPDMPEISIKDSYIVENGDAKKYTFHEEFRKAMLNRFFHDIIAIYNSFN